MQNEERKLRYSPVHLFNLQTALKYFENCSDNMQDDKNVKEKELAKESPIIEKAPPTKLFRLESGNKCPNCDMPNYSSTHITVFDRNYISRTVEALSCQCGTKYLTKNLFKKLKNSGKDKIIDIVTVPAPKPVLNSKTTIIVGATKKQVNKSTQICRKCGAHETVYGSPFCYSCYKEEKQATYE